MRLKIKDLFEKVKTQGLNFDNDYGKNCDAGQVLF